MMYNELIEELRRHHYDAKEDDTQEVCEECAYDVIIADKSVPSGIASVCVCGLMNRAADAIEDLFAELRMEKVDNINLTGQLVEEHAKRQWISVKDRLPSQDGYYLVAYKLDVIPPRWHFNVYPFSLDLYNTDKFDFPRKKYKGKSGFYYYDSEYGYVEDSRVTHWMPLPTPPKENKDD